MSALETVHKAIVAREELDEIPFALRISHELAWSLRDEAYPGAYEVDSLGLPTFVFGEPVELTDHSGWFVEVK